MNEPTPSALPQTILATRGNPPAALPIRTRVIRRRKDFDALFEGDFQELRAITYVVSPSLLIDVLTRRNYKRLEVVVGEDVANDYKQEMQEKGADGLRPLLDAVQQGQLQVFIPPRTIHTKLYILIGTGNSRVIVTSANFTETARAASRQINYAWYADLPQDDPLLQQVLADYENQKGECARFMGDLLDLLKESKPEERETVMRTWLASQPDTSEEVAQATQEVVQTALEASVEERPLITLSLPQGAARRNVEKLLGPALSTDGVQGRLDVREALANLQTVIGLPFMAVQPSGVILTVGGTARRRSAPLADAATVNAALQNLEDYCNTVDLGQAGNPQMVKTAFLEVILYVLTAPFLHEWMKAYRTAYGHVIQRGPRMLYLFGTSRNGKSTLLRFALKLLTGSSVNPLAGKEFKKTRISWARQAGTVFPLAFDDVPMQSSVGLEEIIKSYWEVWWASTRPQPQLVVTSNNPRLKEWAQSRMKRVDLLVHFPPDPKHNRRLSELFEFDNRLFEWFAFEYLQRWKGEVSQEDELALARQVMLSLYGHAKRPVPECFPRGPIEKLYDPGREVWRDLLFGLRKAHVRRLRGRARVDFAEDMPDAEVVAYQSHLAPHLNVTKAGRTLVVENPEDFFDWLGRPQRRFSNLWGLIGS